MRENENTINKKEKEKILMNKLFELLQYDAKHLILDFEQASIEGRGTPQEISDRRESSIVRRLLSKYFPFPFRVAKGNIVDIHKKESHSIDCLLLNPIHPYTVDPDNDHYSTILAGGVDAAIEIKPTLENNKNIEEALKQIQSVKVLQRGIGSQLLVEDRIQSWIFSTSTYVNKNYFLKKL